MLKIWSMVPYLLVLGRKSRSLTLNSQKQQQQKDEATQGGATKKKKVTAAQLRVQRGMIEPDQDSAAAGTAKNKSRECFVADSNAAQISTIYPSGLRCA